MIYQHDQQTVFSTRQCSIDSYEAGNTVMSDIIYRWQLLAVARCRHQPQHSHCVPRPAACSCVAAAAAITLGICVRGTTASCGGVDKPGNKVCYGYVAKVSDPGCDTVLLQVKSSSVKVAAITATGGASGVGASIADYVAGSNADLVVLGSRDLHGWQR